MLKKIRRKEKKEEMKKEKKKRRKKKNIAVTDAHILFFANESARATRLRICT